ncbi:cell envelope biogenesis protein OmpA [Algibacter marinivivus]|uniref:Cell envelope biogenesis protein OmpA n=1 Tax=Algibacter marinivivus TaxID=2100723 RepID=A0A2U2X726_9FLAO|nr:outer membrane beta-barrel protein [Algibacter marinivivus]PWH83550.1 cell envelope biogenesis protein OmpA [Algibacter marinivivus]
MTSNFKLNTQFWLALAFLLVGFSSFSQGDTSTVKAQFALGVNSPSSNGFVDDFQANSINFPTINLGVQYMFKPLLGAKLDFGFNRFSNIDNTPDFKVNYSRINIQVVYDASIITSFSDRMGAFIHVGPGFSMIKPLGNFGENKTSYLNAMGGIELHYGISDKLSVYLDTSYIFGFGKDFNPVSDGFGSFNGDLLTITFGASISLSGCYYCGD